MIYLFILLQLLDAYTTHTILGKGGVELNPILAPLFEKFGHIPILLVFKAVAIGMVWASQPYLPYVVEISCALYIVVVGHNIYQLLKNK